MLAILSGHQGHPEASTGARWAGGMCPLALRDSGTVVDPHETSKLTRDPNAERTQECQRKQTTGHQMLRVCSPGLPALAGVLSVATLGSVRPKSAHMHSRRVLGSNGLHTGNVRETAVATAVSTMAARCSRGFAGLGTWAPELAKDALRCIPSRSSLPEALVVLGDIRHWLPWSYERDTQETLLGLGGFGNEPARRRRSCRPSERAPALGTGAV